jgi:pimeloyl-ACP methyl ester carboxylesterase
MDWSLEHGMVVRRTAGTGTGPCLVWIHGLGESSVSWEPVIEALPEYDHVLVDLPGYGRSPYPDEVVGLTEVASRLARWLANERPSVLVGHSMGGVLATLVAELAPLHGVIDVDGNLTRGDCTFSAAAAEYSLAAFLDHGFAEIKAKVFADGAHRAELRGYHAAMSFASPHCFHRHSRDLIELSESDTLAVRLAQLKVPKLFIAGVPDGICVASRARLDELHVPWEGIEPAGHWVYLDQLRTFTSSVRTFMSRLTA